MENCFGGAGGCDDDVGAVAGIVEVVELDGLAVEPLREAYGPIVGAIGNENRTATVGHQVAGGEFAHLSGADEKDVLAVQASEDLLGQLDGD